MFRLRGAAKLHETDPPRGLHPTDLTDDGARTIALLGPNGSGKSTLLGLLSGRHRPTAGEVQITGRPAGIDAAARSRVGIAFQTPALDALLTVRENLYLFAALHGLHNTRARVSAAVSAAMDRFDLAEHADRRVERLSGGLARRADLARATLHDPALLLLDEPSAGLDPAATDALFAALDEYAALDELAARPDGPAVLWSTHDLSEAERAERVVILREGRVAVDGAPPALIEALGARVLRTPSPLPADLDTPGLTPRPTANGRVMLASGDPDALGTVAESLNARGIGFSLAPPTLRDVYEGAMA